MDDRRGTLHGYTSFCSRVDELERGCPSHRTRRPGCRPALLHALALSGFVLRQVVPDDAHLDRAPGRPHSHGACRRAPTPCGARRCARGSRGRRRTVDAGCRPRPNSRGYMSIPAKSNKARSSALAALRIDEHASSSSRAVCGQRQIERHRDDEFVVVQVQHQTVAEHDPLDHASPDPRFGHFFTLARRATAHKALRRAFRSIGGGAWRWT